MRNCFATFFALAALNALAQGVDSEMLPPERWPTTVSATVADIVQRMRDEDKKRIRDTKKSDLIQYHHGWGTQIRNYYGLWRGNDKLLTSACGKICHPDDASVIIIEAVWTTLQK